MLASSLVIAGLLSLAQAAVYTVTVGIVETDGQPGLGFDPSSIRPAAGDTITFTYALPEYIKNPSVTQHSATQSTFENPCSKMDGGFDTGIQSTGSVNSNTGNSYDLTVNDTNPLWFFSAANSDCKSGMVLAVNPPISGDQTAAAFQEKAKSSSGTSTSSSPSSSSTSVSAQNSVTGTGTASSSSAASTATESANTGNNNGALSVAQIELAFAGVVALVGLVLVA
ncbi:hypothetical protein QCA50_014431 [Cerrena zonata]|uniref:Uncharacterized protein n=1 Tax=Cerrena zonata TaxID=2478898 RepID=A0AAW0FP69_9APHY